MSVILVKLFSRFLYILPNCIFNLLVKITTILIGKVIQYRKKVILHNLKFIFPDKSAQELHQIKNKFYAFISQMALTSLKNLSESPDVAIKRVIAERPDIFKQYEESGQSIIITGGHHYDWETGMGFSAIIKPKCVYMYKPAKSKKLDDLLKKTRGKCGGLLASGKEIVKYLRRGVTEPFCYIFVSDQHTTYSAAKVPVKFFNHEIGFIAGPEKFAKKFDYPIFFGKIKPAANGQCKTEFILISDNPKETQEGEITQKVATMLEEQIIHEPWFWLLSHKRFKDNIDYKQPCKL